MLILTIVTSMICQLCICLNLKKAHAFPIDNFVLGVGFCNSLQAVLLHGKLANLFRFEYRASNAHTAHLSAKQDNRRPDHLLAFMYLLTARLPNQKLIMAAKRPAVASSQIRDSDLPKSLPLSIRAIRAVTLMATNRPKKQ